MSDQATDGRVRQRLGRRGWIAAAGAVAIGIATLAGPIESAAAPQPATFGNHHPGWGWWAHWWEKLFTLDVQLLAFNDYHGHLEADTPRDVEGEPGGGSEYLSTKLNELREGNRNSLTVSAGDNIGGSPFLSGLFHDEPSVESLNALGLDVSSVGNHDFDEGVEELYRMQEGGCHPVDGCYFPDDPYEGADFQWLAANVIDEETRRPILPPVWVEEFGHVKVGFIGMTLEATPTLVAQAGIEGYEFRDEVETANRLVRKLKRYGVETIIVLLHEGGMPVDGGIDDCNGVSGPIIDINAGLHPEIDVLITGHTHKAYNCVLEDPLGRDRIVTSAFSFGRVVSEINLKINRWTGDVKRHSSSATNHAVIQSELTPDPALTAVLDKWRPISEEVGNRPVGSITADINRGGDPTGDDRGVESDAGNLVADAQQWATTINGAEVAFMNPGGVRSDLLFASSSAGEGDGVVTYAEAFTFQPFGNLLSTMPMTGAQIRAVLEEQCQPAGSSRSFLHLGVSGGFTYDLSKTIVGGDCTGITVSNIMLNGVALDMAVTYQVTVNNFLADGNDNFTTFATIDPSLRVGGGVDLDALTDYLGSVLAPIGPPGTDRVNELT
jgi:5'-nucleotidase